MALVFVVSGAGAPPSAAQPPGGELPAVVLERGSVAADQIVALGRDLEIHGEALRNAAVLGAGAHVTGSVAGDLVVLGGDAHLGPRARIRGDAFVLGGRLDLEAGARVDCRTVSYPGAPSSLVLLLEGPALGLPPFSPLVLAAKSALLLAWLAVGLLLYASFGRSLWSTGQTLSSRPLFCFYVGLVAVLSMLLTTLFLTSFTAVVVGVPFLLLVVLMAVVLKLWGTVAVFLIVGEALLLRGRNRIVEPIYALLLGIAVLGAVKFLPWVGVWVWSGMTLVGVGAALLSKLGRQQPWLEAT